MLFFNRNQPPHPDYTNVEISGRGWYKYSCQRGKWHRYKPTGFDLDARWLSDRKLLEFAVDAVIAARGRK